MKNAVVITIVLVTTAVLLPSVLGGCSAADPTLKLAVSQRSLEAFDETGTVVVRCTSLTTEGGELTFSPTKSIGATITALMFFNGPGPDGSGDAVDVMLVPLTGAEWEYSLESATGFTVSSVRAAEVTADYGILYDDWLEGCLSGSELFPCCE